jgi:hypothetical protein
MSTKNNYISHIITDENNHSIVFDADDNEIKVKLIDYLAIYSNPLLITKIEQTNDVLVDNTVIIQYRVRLKCGIKEARALINYLAD